MLRFLAQGLPPLKQVGEGRILEQVEMPVVEVLGGWGSGGLREGGLPLSVTEPRRDVELGCSCFPGKECNGDCGEKAATCVRRRFCF